MYVQIDVKKRMLAVMVSLKGFGLLCLLLPLVQCQTSTSSVRYNTVSNDGHLTSYRAIPTPPASIDETYDVLPNIDDSRAVDPQTVCPGYNASNVVKNDFGFTADLDLVGDACNVYGTDIQSLAFSLQYQNADRLRLTIVPKYLSSNNASQYIIEPAYVMEPTLDSDANTTTVANDLQFTWSNVPTFNFAVIRQSSGDVLFNTAGSKLVFENQFVEFVTSMPENYNLYGLGETIHPLRLGNNYTKTIYNVDAGDVPDANIYGTHPFVLDTRYYEVNATTNELTLVTSNTTNSSSQYTSLSHGLYLRNAHGQEILLRAQNVTWRTLGGSIDLTFFSGPTQPLVTQQYLKGAIGLPVMQQYFTFGFHQCRWGYQNWSVLQDVVDNMRSANIPLENIWTDIDYMNHYRDFENDPNTFGYAEGAQFLQKLNAAGQHYIPIVDTNVYIPNPSNASDAYPSYERGHDMSVFLTNADGSEYIGNGWPGYSVFPDFRAPNTQEWWTNEMVMYHRNISFSGIWIDLSEPSSFCVGSCGSGNLDSNPVHPPFKLPGEPGNVDYGYPEMFNITNSTEAASISALSASQASSISATMSSATSTTSYLRTTPTAGSRNLNFPPYVINNVNGALPVHAIAPNATHYDNLTDYDIHNLYGHEILNATYNALLQVFPGKRPFIIGRSTFAGSGRYAGHWGGDNVSKWLYMYYSIPQALSFSLFGIPMFGVDTCGFTSNTDEELCNRWMQLSAFFPFYRNHNVYAAISQEPYRWASVAEASRVAMHIRYSLLPYMYTLFYQAHTTGSTVMRALAWEFPSEPSLAAADRQFLLGPALLVTPVLEPLATTVNGVFPGVASGEVWYDWYNQTAVNAVAFQNTTIDAPLGHIPVYVRGGYILPMQQPGYTTTESRQNAWSLLVALNKQGTAEGQLYIDDGESIVPNATRYVDITATQNGNIYASGRGAWNDTNALANITVLGVQSRPTNVTFNGDRVNGVAYNASSKVLSITGLDGMTMGGAWMNDWTLNF